MVLYAESPSILVLVLGYMDSVICRNFLCVRTRVGDNILHNKVNMMSCNSHAIAVVYPSIIIDLIYSLIQLNKMWSLL